ncbi:MAG: glycosyltransferase [Sediminibacterium sp.]|nr:glycosyltransferase [Sediminibacterium sp.]
MARIILTVTNDLSFDQRMQRIAGTLQQQGHEVTLVGRKRRQSIPLAPTPFRQVRLACFSDKGPLFYIEFNIRLLLFLLSKSTDYICSIDLDTILPCLAASVIRKTDRLYDAHEYFTEQKEIIRRPTIQRIWKVIERFAVPHFQKGYTVNTHLATLFREQYGVNYAVIRNIPVKYQIEETDNQSINKFILYQGAVNEGRCFEQLIPAMKWVNAPLYIVGSGNFMEQVAELIRYYQVEHKVFLKGSLPPDQLRLLTRQATIGVTLFEPNGINQYYSLANRFFDYMMAGIPQICVNYPLYAELNNQYGFAELIPDTHPLTIGAALNKLLNNTVVYEQLRQNCLTAREILHWENEAGLLTQFYSKN